MPDARGISRVDDPADARLADYLALTDAERRRGIETGAGTGEGIFIAEGVLAVDRLLGSRYPVRSVLLAPERVERVAARVPPLVPVYVASHEVLAALTGYRVHRGVLASAQRLPLPDPREVMRASSLLLVLAGISDHENLGAAFRNVAAFGAGGVLLDPSCADPLYRRSVRVSVGHVLHVPYARLRPWPEALGLLRAEGFRAVALTPRPAAGDLAGAGLGGQRVALLLGAEGPGLEPEVLSGADVQCRIPLAGTVDSLNVATAAAIALYELTRGRL